MNKHLIWIVSILLLGAACSGPVKNKENEKSLQESIVATEDQLFNNDGVQIERADALKLIELYEQFASEYPKDSLAPVYLYRASDISMNLQRPVKTIALFNKLLTDYPDFEKVPSVMFLKAFVYEDQLHDLDKAKKYYEEFLAQYPDSEFADDAEISLKNLGKSPEELIQEFEQNNP